VIQETAMFPVNSINPSIVKGGKRIKKTLLPKTMDIYI
jgi:hypothetical protein